MQESKQQNNDVCDVESGKNYCKIMFILFIMQRVN